MVEELFFIQSLRLRAYKSIRSLSAFELMDFRYRWKNGTPPSRDEAARNSHLLDESQFENEKDRNLAEEAARKHLNVPTRVPDEDFPVLPTAPPPDQKM
jgi:hypothetical protein